MNSSAQNRQQYIDIARGIAIICIILGHLGNSAINRVVFTFHVPVFFLITGYFLNSNDSHGVFVKKRARSLLVPYAVASGAVILLCMLKSLFVPEMSVWKEAATWIYAAAYGAGDTYWEPFYIPAIGAIWFLLATFWGGILLHRLLRLKAGIRLVIILAVFAASVLSAHYIWLPFSLQAGGCAILFMYFGHCIRQYREAVQAPPKEVTAVGMLFAFAVWISFIWDFQSFWLVHCDLGRGVIDIFGSLCAVFCVMFISKLLGKYTGKFGSGLAYLGRFSILVLCVHEVELSVFPWGAATRMVNHMGLSETFLIYVIIAAKLVLNIVLTVLLSKSKAIRRLFAIKTG